MATQTETPIAALESTFRGDLLTPDDGEAYHDARRVWNGMINKYPAVVARCAGVADVMAAVNVAQQFDLPVAVRGGGHNVAGTATCDDGIVVDLSGMRSVRVDPEAKTARVEGGATWADVDRATQQFGLATPGGVVSETGVAGLTLGGGLGHLRRQYGLSCDNLRSVDVVTADGELVTASEARNDDLFWAVRGGGGNFGVVTSFEFDLHEVGPEVAACFVFHEGDRATEALRFFRETADELPTEMSVIPVYAWVPETEEFPEARWGDPAVVFLGCHCGDTEEGMEALAPLREFGDPIADFSGVLPYVELQSMLDADYPNGRNYYWKSIYVDDLDDDTIERIVELSDRSPSKLSTVDLWHLGGAVNEVDADATAFGERDAPYLLNFEANWDDPRETAANVAWVRESVEEMEQYAADTLYVNFPGFGEEGPRAAFGDNYDRLREVKTKYDPGNLFRLNQNVEPTD